MRQFFFQNQWKDRQVTMEKLLLLIDSKKAEFSEFERNMNFCILSVYLFSKMLFKGKFSVYLIL